MSAKGFLDVLVGNKPLPMWWHGYWPRDPQSKAPEREKARPFKFRRTAMKFRPLHDRVVVKRIDAE